MLWSLSETPILILRLIWQWKWSCWEILKNFYIWLPTKPQNSKERQPARNIRNSTQYRRNWGIVNVSWNFSWISIKVKTSGIYRTCWCMLLHYTVKKCYIRELSCCFSQRFFQRFFTFDLKTSILTEILPILHVFLNYSKKH